MHAQAVFMRRLGKLVYDVLLLHPAFDGVFQTKQAASRIVRIVFIFNRRGDSFHRQTAYSRSRNGMRRKAAQNGAPAASAAYM